MQDYDRDQSCRRALHLSKCENVLIIRTNGLSPPTSRTIRKEVRRRLFLSVIKFRVRFSELAPSQFEVFMAPIAVGNSLPDGVLSYFDSNDSLQEVSIHSLAYGKKIILFGVPGAFTPTCSLKHVPGFIDLAPEFKSKGIDELICLTVNDPFVVKAWGQTYPNNTSVRLLADGSAKYTHALGLELDLSEKGLGIRSKRFALLVDNLVIKVANIEQGGEFSVSSAEDMLKVL